MSSISTQARGIQRPCWLPGKRLWYVLAPQRATPPDIHNAMFSPAIRTSHKLGSVVHLHQTTWLRRSKRLSASTCARRWRYEIKFTYWHMGCNSDTKSRTLSTAWLHTRLRQDCGHGASLICCSNTTHQPRGMHSQFRTITMRNQRLGWAC